VGVLAVVASSGCQWDETRFFDLRVVNDTHRAVAIRPCWDLDCLNMRGMPITVLRPGDSRHEDEWWANDAGNRIAVAVLRPGRKRIVGCLITAYAQGQPSGVVRLSQERPCITAPENGPGG
jgi:hypothetical protein